MKYSSLIQIVPQPTVTLLRTFDPCHLSEYGHLGEVGGHLSEKSESEGEGHLGEEVAANLLYGRLDRDDVDESERPGSGSGSGASGGQRPPAPRPRKNLPAAAKKINFGLSPPPPKPPRNFNYALFGRDGDGDEGEGDSEVCEKPKKATKEDSAGPGAVKGKKKSKMKLQLEELGRMTAGKGRKGERKDSLKGNVDEDSSRGIAIENLYVTLPMPPSNESSPEKRLVVHFSISCVVARWSSLFSSIKHDIRLH